MKQKFFFAFLFCLLSTAVWGQPAAPPTLEELRDKLAANTRELSPSLGTQRLPEDEVQAALTAFSTAEDILAKNITEEFRVWTLKRKAAALITLAYERTPEFYPALVEIVEELDGRENCDAIITEAERHVLLIGAQLAVAPMENKDGKKISMALQPLARRMVFFAEQNPGRESERMIRFFLSKLDRPEERREVRDRRLALVVPVFIDYYAKKQDRESFLLAEELRRVQRRLELPGNVMKLDGLGLDGSVFDRTLLKNKVVLVQFWGTWCQFCLQEMPLLCDLYEKYHADGLEIVGINTAVRGDERLETVQRFVATTTFGVGKKKMTWPIIHESLSAANKVEPISRYYGIVELPMLVLVGRNGKVLEINPAPATLERCIQNALPEISLDDLTDEEKAKAEEVRKQRDAKLDRAIRRELEMIQGPGR